MKAAVYPPEDYENGSYHESVKDLHIFWLVTLAEMMMVPTLHHGEATFITPWLPWEASKKPDFKLVTLYLHFCPITVWNFCSDHNGGHMSPIACCFADGSLRSAICQIL